VTNSNRSETSQKSEISLDTAVDSGSVATSASCLEVEKHTCKGTEFRMALLARKNEELYVSERTLALYSKNQVHFVEKCRTWHWMCFKSFKRHEAFL